MTLPGFTAEAATAPASGYYGHFGSGAAHAASGVLPAAFPKFPIIRCCGWSSLLQRFICTQRRNLPFDRCRCERTPYGPVILCDPIVFEPA